MAIGACGSPAETPPAPSASTSPVATAAVSSSSPSSARPSAAPERTPSAAVGGVEVWATGSLQGTYAWVLRERTESQPTIVTATFYAVPVSGGSPQMVLRYRTQRGSPAVVLSRQMSPDGTRLALEQPNLDPAAHDGFLVVDLRSGRITELARGDAMSDTTPAWSPDGSMIAFARAKPGATPVSADQGLWVIAADGSGLRQVLPAATQAQRTYVYGWTADGAGIAYGLAFEGLTYAIVDPATGKVIGPTLAWSMSLAPGSWRAKAPQFVGAFSEGDKGGAQRIVVADAPGKAPRTIALEEQREPGDPIFLNARWSTTGDEIAFIRSSRQSKLVRMSVDGSSRREIDASAPTQIEWLPDGRIAYVSNANGIGSVLRATDGTTDTKVLDFLGEGGASFVSLAVRTYPGPS